MVRNDSDDKNFSFDSVAEQEQARILVNLTDEDAPTGNGRIIKGVTIKEIVDEEELISRLLERGKVSGRSDDNLETIKSRLEVYHNQTAPLADYYVGEGKHVAIKGMGTIEEIFDRIKEAVNNVK